MYRHYVAAPRGLTDTGPGWRAYSTVRASCRQGCSMLCAWRSGTDRMRAPLVSTLQSTATDSSHSYMVIHCWLESSVVQPCDHQSPRSDGQATCRTEQQRLIHFDAPHSEELAHQSTPIARVTTSRDRYVQPLNVRLQALKYLSESGTRSSCIALVVLLGPNGPDDTWSDACMHGAPCVHIGLLIFDLFSYQ